MSSRNTKDIAIAKVDFQPEDSGLLSLEYSLLCVTGEEGEPLYALRAELRDLDGALVEREETRGITGSLEDATAMALAFVEGTVPPCVLLEMTEEWEHYYLNPLREA